MRKPNFCILGAPKCGTTALAQWLAAREDVFVTPVKEPHHFNTDGGYPGIRDRAAYEALYEAAGPQHRAVGEASVGYLSSEAAVANLLDYAPDIRLIACLRNPLEMLPSLHQQYVFNSTEPLTAFADAWAASATRASEGWTASSGSDWRVFDYRRMGRLGAQVERLFRVAGRERCHIVLMEDLRADPQAVFRDVLGHIGASTDGIGPLSAVNKAKTARLPWLRRAMVLAAKAKRGLGVTRSFGLAREIDNLNKIEEPWTPLPAALAAEMAEAFREDVALLSELLNRDLTDWLDGTA